MCGEAFPFYDSATPGVVVHVRDPYKACEYHTPGPPYMQDISGPSANTPTPSAFCRLCLQQSAGSRHGFWTLGKGFPTLPHFLEISLRRAAVRHVQLELRRAAVRHVQLDIRRAAVRHLQ